MMNQIQLQKERDDTIQRLWVILNSILLTSSTDEDLDIFKALTNHSSIQGRLDSALQKAKKDE